MNKYLEVPKVIELKQLIVNQQDQVRIAKEGNILEISHYYSTDSLYMNQKDKWSDSWSFLPYYKIYVDNTTINLLDCKSTSKMYNAVKADYNLCLAAQTDLTFYESLKDILYLAVAQKKTKQ